jgi:hypothetical protein
MILPKVRDPRFVTIRRGGTLTDSDHRLLALWAASCADHVLDLFESVQPEDPRPRRAIEHARAWVRGEVSMTQARAAGGHAMGAARDLRGAARHAAYAAGQAGAVAHVAAHELGAAAYANKAVRAAAPEGEGDAAGRLECQWQRDQLPAAIRELVLDDQRLGMTSAGRPLTAECAPRRPHRRIRRSPSVAHRRTAARRNIRARAGWRAVHKAHASGRDRAARPARGPHRCHA